MATNVSTWLGTALPTTQATTTWLANQAGCQKYFLERDYAVQDELTRRVYKENGRTRGQVCLGTVGARSGEIRQVRAVEQDATR